MQRSVITLSVLVFLAPLTVWAEHARPNVVVIVADDLGFSDLGCYGGEIATPHLDGLARGGLRFTQFYNTARCWPSRGALLTGYYAQQIRRDTVPGVRSGGQGVRPAWARLLPEMLRQSGYRSYHSGKWHVDGPRLTGGFDRSYSIEDHNRYFTPRNHFEDDKPLPAVTTDSGYYATTAIAEHAITCLKDHAEQHAGRPFFSYVAFTAPHFPLQAPQEDVARYRDKYLRGWDAVRRERWTRQKQLGIVRHELPATERDVGPPYHFSDALATLGAGEVNRPLPWDELTDEPAKRLGLESSLRAPGRPRKEGSSKNNSRPGYLTRNETRPRFFPIAEWATDPSVPGLQCKAADQGA